jgi:hypothetical protein
MLFRPSFCCNCGEKIERAEWKLWTSRRFCDLCATDFTLQEFAPKGVILLASIISVFGVVSYCTRAPDRRELVAGKTVEKPQSTVSVNNAATPQTAPTQLPVNSIEDRRPQTLAAMPPANVQTKPAVDGVDSVYICGAATRKGTPCSRRVKGPVRCWQHVGQPAILPPNQLRVAG